MFYVYIFEFQVLKYKHIHWFYLFLMPVYHALIELFINRVQVSTLAVSLTPELFSQPLKTDLTSKNLFQATAQRPLSERESTLNQMD